ncbi:acyl-CoA-binding protein [Myroides guanonis]|uniref:Acyl-CoA-binding protein n=1 Tax=Myroides guanonis TaxID=1150112 RepID=A0A1I3QTW3_9FLAO|nr:acyl-CoA-binding protein [Myroides guanonis]SFJ36681.1 Acyl-CoA-binding protein [Myroides guanonis]
MDSLDKEFEEAYTKISEEAINLPPDVMLRIYAYYKQATQGLSHKDFENMSQSLKNSFKFNAWTQVSHLSTEEAKREYIKIAHEIFKEN